MVEAVDFPVWGSWEAGAEVWMLTSLSSIQEACLGLLRFLPPLGITYREVNRGVGWR